MPLFWVKADEVLALEGYGKYDPMVDYYGVKGLKKVLVN